MNLDELKSSVKADMKIDPTLLDSESLNTPVLHGKYMTILLDRGIHLKRLLSRQKMLRKELFEYYSGKAPDEVYKRKGDFNMRLLKTQIGDYIESDPEWVELQTEIDTTEEVVKFVEGVMKMINNRGFAIKNAIDWRRFSAGMS